MEKIDYSVIIRTIGKANIKYQKLLNSIASLEPKPVEVIVVLPVGYEKPQQQLGYETFCFSPKGMVEQRMYGLNVCKTKYALFCDDDVEFDKDFVNKLYKPIRENKCSFSAGPLYSFLPSGMYAGLSFLMGAAMPTLFNKHNYCTVLSSTGYSYNRHLNTNKDYYYSQSLPWTCFLASVEAFKKVDLESELWLNKHNYAGMDDQTMFYKGHLMGYKTCVVPNALYIHNDAKTSSKNNADAMLYALSFNRTVFWHRFIYNRKNNIISKLFSKVCFGYYKFCSISFFRLLCLLGKKPKNELISTKNGYKDGKKYLKTEEYNSLIEY